jgi:hypothetical protein
MARFSEKFELARSNDGLRDNFILQQIENYFDL